MTPKSPLSVSRAFAFLNLQKGSLGRNALERDSLSLSSSLSRLSRGWFENWCALRGVRACRL